MGSDPAELLRQHGYRVTAKRLAVMRAVASRPHLTAEDVVEIVRSDIGAISRRAVYDAVGSLAADGLLRRIQPAGSAARYEYTGDADDYIAATFFFDRVAQHHSYATGGHGLAEYFGFPDEFANRLDGRTCRRDVRPRAGVLPHRSLLLPVAS